MPRIRSIKPGFFRSEDVSALPLRARLTWIGLWTHCDDAGRAKDNVRLIKGDVWPLDDVSLRDIEEDLETLADHGRIVRYEVDGRRYLEVVNWRDHQAIQKPTPSKIPPPPSIPDDSGRTTGGLPEDSGTATAGKGKEGRGREGTRARARESPPPRTCPDHTDDPDPPPCGSCADARRRRDQWDRHRADQAAAAQSAEARDRAATARTAIDACTTCGPDGYLPSGPLCAHDPNAGQRTQRGAAAARAELQRPGAAP